MTEQECDAFWVRAKEKLRDNKLSLKEYSAVTGIPLQTIYGQIKKHRLPSAEDFLVLARICHSNPEWLLWGDSPPTPIKELLAAYSSSTDVDRERLVELEVQMQELIKKLKELK
jgi:hypothetical protein